MGEPAAIRVGWGYDIHRLDGEPPLILGGVVISDVVGVTATSDGDVLAHAITDAVLGAAVKEDIGAHFPSKSPASQGIDSLVMLKHAVDMARDSGWVIAHIDATVLAENISIAPHRDAIRQRLSSAVSLDTDSISVKATTTDGLGPIGSGDGIAAVATLTLTTLT
jgi:2-C-methyl-D-erythritol 2,4-cyclodiphosphate synthase